MGRRPASFPVPPPRRKRSCAHLDTADITQHGDVRYRAICLSCGVELIGDIIPVAATGKTTRLRNQCASCGDELPTGAAFCIACGERQEG